MSTYVVGIDIGTTGTKAVLLDVDQGIIAVASRDSVLFSPQPGFAEADTAVWLRNVHESIRQLLSETGVRPVDVVALSTSGMVPAVIPISAKGMPLRPAILQNDARATTEVARYAEALSDIDLVTLTGSALTQQSVLPTLEWIRRHEPGVWARTAYVVGSYDWILCALGADPHLELNWAIESGLFSLDASPLSAVLQVGELDAGLLPKVLSPGDHAGSLNATAAEACGLLPGTALVVGGADHVLSAFSAGVDHVGDWLVKLGGAGDILVASDRPVVDPRLYLDAHPISGRWLPNGCMATSGSLIRWVQALVGGSDLQRLDAEAAERRPAEVLCLPYFLGEKSPIHDPDLRGTFAGLHLGHTRADLYRSVLEAIAFGFRHHTDVFREIGLPLGRAMITNGGSRSTLWKQIHSEVLGTEMFPVVAHPGASLGAALMAAVGVDAMEWGDTRRFLTLASPVVPDPARVARYDQAYTDWRALADAVSPISHAISRRARA